VGYKKVLFVAEAGYSSIRMERVDTFNYTTPATAYLDE
jgi:hypothetical protein